MTRRIPGRCTYCGYRIKLDCLVCGTHRDIPALDPHYRFEARRPVVLELRRAA